MYRTIEEIDKEFEEKFGRGYNKNKIVLMPQEPETLYAYWEISKNDREKLKESELVLRLFNLTDKSVSLINIGKNNFLGNYYIRSGVKPYNQYIAEIDSLNGDFYPIFPIISNSVKTPRNNESPDTTVEFWDPITEEIERERLKKAERKRALELIRKGESQIKKDRSSSDSFHNYFIK